MIQRGHIYWLDLGENPGSRPAGIHPVLIVQADQYNISAWATIVVAVLTSNLDLATLPGNVSLPAQSTGLPKDSVVNLTALATVNKIECGQVAGVVPQHLMEEVDTGLRRILGLVL